MKPWSPFSSLPAVVATRVADRVQSWAVESQLGARRNAMVASTRLATRRAERAEVDDYFAALTAPDALPTAPPSTAPLGRSAGARS